jgi:thiamine biosynthesis lipoprotein
MADTTIRPMPVLDRRIKVEHVMGTMIAIDVRDNDVPEKAINEAFAWLRAVDERFSTYKPESEISRLGRGETTVEECHPDVATILAICEDLRLESRGAFNAWRARPDGRLDPSGLVKGWATQIAAELLRAAGAGNFAINAAGDVIACGYPEPGRRWRVGIRHPHDQDAVATVLEITDLAVATSGSYERGPHILDARTGQAARGLLSLTVAGPSLTLADAYATAGFALGEPGIGWASTHAGYAACGITVDGQLRFSETFGSLMTANMS